MLPDSLQFVPALVCRWTAEQDTLVSAFSSVLIGRTCDVDESVPSGSSSRAAGSSLYCIQGAALGCFSVRSESPQFLDLNSKSKPKSPRLR